MGRGRRMGSVRSVVLVLVLVPAGQLPDESLEFELALLDGGEQLPDLRDLRGSRALP